jgi:putative spermidine/putrescine transport system ATP-binding protein
MHELDTPVDGDSCTANGHVREVVYLGATTRYIVELDRGGSLVVMQQNLATSSMEALQVRGKAVRLIWRRSNNRPVEAPAGALAGSMDQEEAQAS